MKRRVIILIISFVVLMAAFWSYRLIAHVSDGGQPNKTNQTPPPIAMPGSSSRTIVRGTGQQMPEPENLVGVEFISRDDVGALRARYVAERWDKVGDQSYRLTKPDVELRLKGGQRVYVTADTGAITIDGSGSNPPTRLSLSGNVCVEIDRATMPTRTLLKDRPDDRATIRVDEADFDNELLRVSSNSKVVVNSSEADIYGTGLLITWKEVPRELEMLRIAKGDRIIVKKVPADVDVLTLPGGPRAEIAETDSPTSEPAGKTTATKPRPSAAVAASKPGDPPPARNIYTAEFSGSVRVVSGPRIMNGADKLLLRFEWDRESSNFQSGAKPHQPAQTGRRDDAAAAGEAGKPVGTMVVTWNGPLVLTPVGYTPTPSSKRVQVSADGTGLVMTDSQTIATCRSFSFWRDVAPDAEKPIDRGELLGSMEAPAVLMMADGSEIVCPAMTFDRKTGQALLAGAGTMTGGANASSLMDSLPRTTTAPSTVSKADKRPDKYTIAWKDSVVANFIEEKVRMSDGTTRLRPSINDVSFRGGVNLTQEGPNGDALDCDTLNVTMARGHGGKAYPAQAVAIGNVKAHQEGSDVIADKATLTFQEMLVPAAGGAAPTYRAQPASVLAEGKVRFTDDMGDGGGLPGRSDNVLIANADKLNSNLITRTAVLTGSPGRPASIVQGSNRLEGPEISLYEVAGASAGKKDVEVNVAGNGNISYLSNRDFFGELSHPQMIHVAWAKSMRYRGPLGLLEFFGDVKATSGANYLNCSDEMNLTFGRDDATAAATTAPAVASRPAGRVRRPMAISMESYSRREIRVVNAKRNVVMHVEESDENGRLVQRLHITGPELQYYATQKTVNSKEVRIKGAGTLVAEDYRPPEPDSARKPTGGSDSADMSDFLKRPSQTALEWTRYMQLLLMPSNREATVSGDVTMRHRSGTQVVLAKDLAIADLGKLTSGRATDLTAEQVVVEFDAPKPGAAAKAGNVSAMVGPLRQFSATRGVNMKDGPWSAIGQAVLYDRQLDAVVIWGYLKDQAVANAELRNEDPSKGKAQTWSSPKITWLRKNDRVTTDRVTAGGGR